MIKPLPTNPVPSDIEWVNVGTDIFTHGVRKISFRLSILPRKCNFSKKNIWFKLAYRVRRIYYGYNGETHNEDRWYTKGEFIKLRLMG